MQISFQELKRLEEWRTTISNCLSMYAAESGPIPAEDKLNNAESAVRLFAACYAKDLVADDFPRNNGFFSDDLKTALCRLLSSCHLEELPTVRAALVLPLVRGPA